MSNQLKKVLTLRDLVLFGIGGTVGAGIFVSIGVGAVQSGPALFLSFLLACSACTISGLCFCEMASRVPTSGSSYSYTMSVLGEFPAFLIGSVLILDSIISAAACARAWSSYVIVVLPFLPSYLSSVSLIDHVCSISVLSAIVCAILGVVLFFGIKETTTFNNISTLLNVLVLSVFVFAGLPLADSSNWVPFAPNGVGGIVRGAGRIFFAFLGFDVVNCLAEETETTAKRMVPRAILLTIAIATCIYVLVSVSFVGLVPLGDINVNAPLSSAFTFRGYSSLAYIVGIGAVGNTLTSVLSNFLVQPRIMMRMATDGLLPENLSFIDFRGVPRTALLISVSASTITAFLVDFETLADMVSVASLVSLSTVCVCSVLARIRNISSNTHGVTMDEISSLDGGLDLGSPGGPDLHRFHQILILYIALCVGAGGTLLYTNLIIGPILASLAIIALFAAIREFKAQETSPLVSDEWIFKVPLSPGLPLVGVFINTYLLLGLPPLALARAVCVFATASAYYWLKLRRRTSHVQLREEVEEHKY